MKAPTQLPTRPSALQRALFGAACGGLALSLTACGGGGSSSPSATTGSVSGVVLDGPIQGATVCLDLNANQQCDSGEPTSAPTDAQGNYTITGLTADQQNSGKEWIAVVPVGATNGGTPVTAAFVLRAPPNQPGVISPISHMVAVAMSQGATSQAAAEAAVAVQLGVGTGSLYGNYAAGSPSMDATILAAHAPGIVALLQNGTQPTIDLSMGQTQAASYMVRQLNYGDAANYYLRVYYFGRVGDHGVFYDVRAGQTGGAPSSQDSLYGTSRYLTSTGWATFGPTTANPQSPGNPYTSFTLGGVNINMRQRTPLDNRPVADAIALANDTSVNSFATFPGVPSTLAGTLPSGAYAETVRSTTAYNPVTYTPSNGSVASGYSNPALTTLDAVIAAFPVVQPLNGGNTLGMGNLQPNSAYACPSGQSTCVLAQQRLRAQFAAGNVVQWSLCDLNWPSGSTAGNCQAIAGSSGSYARSTGLDGQTPLLTFSGLPPQAASMSYTRVFAETDGQVWFGYQNKLGTVTTTRLNDIAFAPIAQQLGITVPANPN